MAFGGKRYRVFLFLKSAAEGKGQFDRDILHFLGGDGLVFLILTVAYSLDEQRVQLVNEASDQPFVHPFRLTDGVSFSQGEALRQFLQQDASLAGAGQFGSAFVVAQLRQEQAAVRGKSRRWRAQP